MRRLPSIALLGGVLAALVAGCSPPPAKDADRITLVRVERSGFFVGSHQVGAGAILRNGGDATVRAIELRVTFFADGKTVSTQRDELPFCPPNAECPWGQRLYGEHVGERWRDIDRVTVEVTRDGGVVRDALTIDRLDVRTTGDAAVVRRSGVEGTAYLLAYDRTTPRSGVSFFIGAGERGTLRYGKELFERNTGDTVRAFVYPGPTPARVRGPVD